MTTVQCKSCNEILTEEGGDGLNRRPCPRCGSLSRIFQEEIKLDASADLRISLLKHKRGTGRSIFEAENKLDLSRKTGRMMNVVRVFDRENNLYLETVTDPKSGEVIHSCCEPLTDHIGHGSARKHHP